MRTVGAFVLLFGALLSAQAGGEQKPKVMPLWPDGAPGAKGKAEKDVPDVTIYLPEKPSGMAMVICPGGGYGGLAMNHEGHQVAGWLNKNGIAGIILKYRHAPDYRHPIPLQDAERAMRSTRAHAKDWGIDPKRIGIIGFSAGGHLASTVGTHFDAGDKDAKDPIDRESCRPDFMVLLYPVIRLSGAYAHGGSRTNLLGEKADEKLIDSLSSDKNVTKETPPTFLAHTSADTAVPPENSLLFFMALNKHKVPAEVHVYEKGRHGLGLGPVDLAFSSWPERCLAWLKGRGLLEK